MERSVQMLIEMYIDEEIDRIIDPYDASRQVILKDFTGYLSWVKRPGWGFADVRGDEILRYLMRPHPITKKKATIRLFWRRVLCLKEFYNFLIRLGYAARNPLLVEERPPGRRSRRERRRGKGRNRAS